MVRVQTSVGDLGLISSINVSELPRRALRCAHPVKFIAFLLKDFFFFLEAVVFFNMALTPQSTAYSDVHYTNRAQTVLKRPGQIHNANEEDTIGLVCVDAAAKEYSNGLDMNCMRPVCV